MSRIDYEVFQGIIDVYYPDGRLPPVRPISYTTLRKTSSGPPYVLPIVGDPTMPPGYFEIRLGDQRIGAWLPESREYHDPGDEDVNR